MELFEYQRLDETDKKYYDIICEALNKCQLKFAINDVDYKHIYDLMRFVELDHPEYFFFNGEAYCRSLEKGEKKEYFFQLGSDEQDEETILHRKYELDRIVRGVAKAASKADSLYRTVLFVHDYLVDNTYYDSDTADNKAKDRDSYTAYGCLVKGKAVCAGYSKAFQMIMQRLGISCGYVRGVLKDGGRHAWNVVKLDEEYYYIDVTWDDPVSKEKKAKDLKTHSYFCITSEEVFKERKPDKDVFAPETVALDYNYYIYNDYFIEKYNFEEFKSIALKQLQNSYDISVKFSSTKEMNRAKKDLIDNDAAFNIYSGFPSFSYKQDENFNILTISLKHAEKQQINKSQKPKRKNYVETYDFKNIRSILHRQIKERKTLVVFFPSKDEMDITTQKLVDDKQLMKILRFKYGYYFARDRIGYRLVFIPMDSSSFENYIKKNE